MKNPDPKKYNFPRSIMEMYRKAFISTHYQFITASKLEKEDLDSEFKGWFGEQWKLEGEQDRDNYIVSRVGYSGYWKVDRKECQDFILAQKNKDQKDKPVAKISLRLKRIAEIDEEIAELNMVIDDYVQTLREDSNEELTHEEIQVSDLKIERLTLSEMSDAEFESLQSVASDETTLSLYQI